MQLPAIKKAKEMGLYVGVADYNPDAVGIPFADEFFEVSTIDENGIYNAAKDFFADGIMTLATDMPMRSVAYACSKLGLTGITHDTAIKATDKGEMIRAFEKSGVEHPWYFILPNLQELDSITDKIEYPCISKPVDNAGSRGVVLVNSVDELKDAVAYSFSNGRNGGVIVEEYLQGNEVSVEIIVYEGKVHVLQITDKLTTGAPHFVEMGHSQPSQLGADNIAAISDLATRAVKSVGIQNGPAHVEIMLTHAGPKMIELGARMGGDCITTHLVPLSTGIDMVKATIDIALGMKPDLSEKFQKGSAILFLKTRQAILQSVTGVEDAARLNGIKEIYVGKKPGDKINDINNSADRIGYIISQDENALLALDDCKRAEKKISIKLC